MTSCGRLWCSQPHRCRRTTDNHRRQLRALARLANGHTDHQIAKAVGLTALEVARLRRRLATGE